VESLSVVGYFFTAIYGIFYTVLAYESAVSKYVGDNGKVVRVAAEVLESVVSCDSFFVERAMKPRDSGIPHCRYHDEPYSL